MLAVALPASSQTWTQTSAIAGNYWSSIACSADGTKVVAACYLTSSFQKSTVFLSTNSGQTWTPAGTPLDQWEYVASSADGTILAATPDYDEIYTSTDSGLTWRSNNVQRRWGPICCSSNGLKMAVAPANFQISTSTNAGVTWVASGPVTNWNSIACSADGTKLAACGGLGDPGNLGFVFTSADSGTTWNPSLTLPTGAGAALGIASSADGTKLVLVTGGSDIYTSTDSGATWASNLVANPGGWYTVASSADGTKLIVGGAYSGGSPIYASSNSGTTWAPTDAPQVWWNCVASSADGNTFYGATWYGNGIYMAQAAPTPPMLNLQLTASQLLIAWPASATGIGLYQNSNLATTNWVPVTNIPEVINSQNQVTLPVGNGNNFYRLQSN
jgi:photosystem II stability/assembly factor-like uncharacterized protein